MSESDARPPSDHMRGEALLHRCLDVLRQRPAAIVTDIDGTISDIAPTPAAATVSDLARAALRALSSRVELVAAVTGRAADDGERLIGLPDLLYVGNHGMEWREAGAASMHPDAVRSTEAVAAALRQIQERLAEEGFDDGVIFENKVLSASIHYRLSPHPEETGRRLAALALAASRARNLRVTDGRYVIELRPAVTINKGTAITDLVDQRGLRGIIFFGDDVTDVDGFRAIQHLKRERGIAGCVVAVASPEANPIIFNESDGVVDGVAAAIALLDDLARRIAD